MFNPLNLLKKKKSALPGAETLAPKPAVEKPVQIDHIAIHTMPERFRRQPARVNSAKSTGWLIIGGGLVFLILASAALYVLLFKKPAVKQEPAAATGSAWSSQTNEAAPETASSPTDLAAAADTLTATSTASSTEPVVLPADNSLATSTATSSPETAEPGLTLGLIPSLDSDSDGLTNAEEILLGAATSTPDTDGDGYLDGAELLNLYDPSASSTKLIANPNISLYENKTFNYTALYPKAWPMSQNGGDDSIMFKSDDNQFFQTIVQANTARQTLDDWYLEQLAAAAINEADRITGAGWQGIKNLDGLTVYLMDLKQNYIFTLAYNPGENNILDYINLFNLMVKSFTLKD